MKTALVEVSANPAALARHAAEWITEKAAIKKGPFAIALSGGSTPGQLYRELTDPTLANRFPWERTHWFWGDERFVPHDDARSNFRMAFEAILGPMRVPADLIHAIPTENLSPAQSAALYEQALKAFYGADSFVPEHPLFDVVLLGLGEDGHTASLFPDSPTLRDRTHWVAPTVLRNEPRITLTFPALESAADVAFLVAGDTKRAILARVRRCDPTLPATRLKPNGTLRFLIDAAAAGG